MSFSTGRGLTKLYEVGICCICELAQYTKQNDKELNTLLNDMEMREGMGQQLTDKLWRVAKRW
jgi:hypothetical protein